MACPPDPPTLRPLATRLADPVGANPPASLAELVFGDWIPDAVRHAVEMAGLAAIPEAEALLARLYRLAVALHEPWTLRVLDRMRAITSCLPAKVSPLDVFPILGLLNAEALRTIVSVLVGELARIGRRRRAISAVQRQVERLNLSPRATSVVREEAAAELGVLAQDHALITSTHRLIQRLAPPKRDAMITAEAQRLFEVVIRAGLSRRRSYHLIAVILRHWHRLPDHALTAAHVGARLQVRTKLPPR